MNWVTDNDGFFSIIVDSHKNMLVFETWESLDTQELKTLIRKRLAPFCEEHRDWNFVDKMTNLAFSQMTVQLANAEILVLLKLANIELIPKNFGWNEV